MSQLSPEIICHEMIDHSEMNRETIVNLLLEYLTDQKICYASVDPSGYDYTSKNEFKIIVPKKSFKNISYNVHEFCNKYGLVPIQKIWHGSTACSFILSFCQYKARQFNPIRISLCSDFKKDGRFYLSSLELLDNRDYVPEKKYWKLNDTYAFLFNLINAIEERSISNKQLLQLFKWWKSAEISIVQHLKTFFKKDSIAIIAQSLNEKNVDHWNAHLEFISKDLKAKVPWRIKDRLLDKVNLLKCVIKPSGLVVGLLGRDGSGKDTFINEMSGTVGACFNGTANFKKFPAIFYKGAIFNKNEGYHFSKPHNYVARGQLASFLKLNLIFIEFMFGYWLKVFPRKWKSELVFYNRYFIDVLADPLRYRIKGNRILIKAFHYILPKPDLWIILDLPTDVLFKRKQELTYEMSEKLRLEYLALQKMLPNSIVIDNGKELESTVNQAASFMLDYMNRKVSKQYF